MIMKALSILVGILGVLLVFTIIFSRSTLKQPQSPLSLYDGKNIVLDFNSPTPTISPSPTPTPTPPPKNTPTPIQSGLTPSPSPAPTSFPVTSEQLDTWFTKYANHYSVDRSKLWKIAECETGLRPNATNWIYGGMFQFSPNTWASNRKLMGMDPNADLRFNPEESIRTAAFVFSTRGPSAWPNCAK